jgi:hypothetical protein
VKTNAKGRNSSGVDRFILVRRELLHSPQFSALSANSRALFFELHAMFNGTNNGAIFLSCRDAADRIGLADLKAVCAAFEELRAIGFITETIGSSFTIKPTGVSKARAWQLNWIGRGGCLGPDCLPPLDFGKLSKVQKRRVEKRSGVLSRYLGNYQKGRFPVEDSTTLEARKQFAREALVEDSSTVKGGNRENPPIRSMGDSSTHINTMGVRGQASPIADDPVLELAILALGKPEPVAEAA